MSAGADDGRDGDVAFYVCSLLQVDIREERVEHHHEQTQGGKEVRGKEGKNEKRRHQILI